MLWNQRNMCVAIIRLPAGMTMAKAASVPLTGLAAFQAVHSYWVVQIAKAVHCVVARHWSSHRNPSCTLRQLILCLPSPRGA